MILSYHLKRRRLGTGPHGPATSPSCRPHPHLLPELSLAPWFTGKVLQDPEGRPDPLAWLEEGATGPTPGSTPAALGPGASQGAGWSKSKHKGLPPASGGALASSLWPPETASLQMAVHTAPAC